MNPDIIKRLEAEIPDELLDKLRQDVVKMVNSSRNVMSNNYEVWDKNLDVYRSQRCTDAEDLKARQKNEPEKMTVPMSYAQVNTLVTFLFLAFTQKESIFELAPTGDEDYSIRDVSQLVVDREIRSTRFHTKLIQVLLDMARLNMGVMKTSWKYESVEVENEEAEISMIFDAMGVTSGPAQSLGPEEVIICEGSYVETISPYNFFPDCRIPITRWKEGRFAADETAVNKKTLIEMEKQGKYAGTEHIDVFDAKDWTNRQKGTILNSVDPSDQKKKLTEDDYMCVVTQAQVRLTPKDYDLSDDSNEAIWVITIVNDNRIIAAEPLNAPHYEFQYDVFQLLPDQHAELSDSLSSLIDPLQAVVTWLINARVAAVRTNIEGRLVVDPMFVDMASLTTGNRYIQLKKNAPRLGVDKFIQQLKTVDPTASHFNDAEALMRIMQTVSGVNENTMGQFTGGRRSATEARAVSAGAASRMKLTAATVWVDALSSVGRKILLNARQDLSYETYEKIVGPTKAADSYSFFHPESPYALIGSEDFFLYDGTLASEKGYIAQSLQDLVIALISNPEVAAASGLDLVAMIEEIQSLRGVKNLSRFKTQPTQQPNANAAGQIAPTPIAPTVS